MPETRTTTTYRFHELSDEAKTVAVENNREFNIHDDWYEFVIGYAKEQLEKIGFDRANISFSGFGSQGDGASFTSDTVYLEKIIAWSKDPYRVNLHKSDVRIPEFNHRFLGWIASSNEAWNELDQFTVKRTSSRRYCHENTCHADIYSVCCLPESADVYLDEFRDQIEQLRLELCQWIYARLEAEYDHLTSYAGIAESLEVNEVEFNVDGGVA